MNFRNRFLLGVIMTWLQASFVLQPHHLRN
jgi:hypothetical protein